MLAPAGAMVKTAHDRTPMQKSLPVGKRYELTAGDVPERRAT